jgi:hypothetical protein
MIRRVLVLALGAVRLLAATACEPFTMRVTVDRKVIVDYGPGLDDDYVQLSGTLQCSADEPPDMGFRLRQFDGEGRLVASSLGSDVSEPCGPEQHTRVRTWKLHPALGNTQVRPGEAELEFHAATNPGSDEEFDRVTINRPVLIVEGQLAS